MSEKLKIWKGRGKVFYKGRHVGHCSKVTQTIATTKEDKKNLMRRNGGKLYEIENIDGVTFSVSMDEIYSDVFAELLRGTVTTISRVAAPINLVFDNVMPGQRLSLGGFGTVTAVTINGEAAELNVNYTTSASAVFAGDAGTYEIDAMVSQHTVYNPLVNSAQMGELVVELENEFDALDKGVLVVPQWQPEVLKTLEWLQEGASTMEVTGEAIANNNVAPGESPFFKFYRQEG